MDHEPTVRFELRSLEEAASAEVKQLVEEARADLAERHLGAGSGPDDAMARMAELAGDVTEVCRSLLVDSFRASTLILQRHLQEVLAAQGRGDYASDVLTELARTDRSKLIDRHLRSLVGDVEAEFDAASAEMKHQWELSLHHRDSWVARVAGTRKVGLPRRSGVSVVASLVGRLRVPIGVHASRLAVEDLELQREVLGRMLG